MMAAVRAASRFGLGPRPGELAAVGDDPRGWLKAQIKASHALPAAVTALPGSQARLTATPPPDAQAGAKACCTHIWAIYALERVVFPESGGAQVDGGTGARLV